MKRLTKEKAVKLHRELWNWLAETGYNDKELWPEWVWNGGPYKEILHDCFSCEYTKERMKKSCNECLIIWGKDDMPCTSNLYTRWIDTDNRKVRKKIAKRIAELPVRECHKADEDSGILKKVLAFLRLI